MKFFLCSLCVIGLKIWVFCGFLVLFCRITAALSLNLMYDLSPRRYSLAVCMITACMILLFLIDFCGVVDLIVLMTMSSTVVVLRFELFMIWMIRILWVLVLSAIFKCDLFWIIFNVLFWVVCLVISFWFWVFLVYLVWFGDLGYWWIWWFYWFWVFFWLFIFWFCWWGGFWWCGLGCRLEWCLFCCVLCIFLRFGLFFCRVGGVWLLWFWLLLFFLCCCGLRDWLAGVDYSSFCFSWTICAVSLCLCCMVR